MQALILAGGEGTRLRPAHLHGPEAGAAAGRPAAHRLRDRLARPPRRRRRDRLLRPPRRGDAERARGARARGRIRYAEEPDAARHRRCDPLRRGHARRAVPRPQRRHPLRPRPDRADRAARAHRARGRRSPSIRSTTRPDTDSSIARRTARSPSSSRSPSRDQIDTDEINAGAYLLERSVLEQIPPGSGGLDRARGLPAADRRRPLRDPARGLLDRHRDAGALPGGELGHPRGPGRDGDRRALDEPGDGGGRVRGLSRGRGARGAPCVVGRQSARSAQAL